MPATLLVLDIDGTLRPHGEPRVPKENVDALRTVQKAGVKLVIATGRCRAEIPAKMLRGIRPDYWICAAGWQNTNRMPKKTPPCAIFCKAGRRTANAGTPCGPPPAGLADFCWRSRCRRGPPCWTAAAVLRALQGSMARCPRRAAERGQSRLWWGRPLAR